MFEILREMEKSILDHCHSSEGFSQKVQPEGWNDRTM
jgi:hypothetical protein